MAGAAALFWRQTEPAAGQGRGEAVARRLYALARDDGAPGFDLAYGNGRLRVETDAPQFAADAPVPGAPVRGVVSAALRFADASGLGPGSLALDGLPLAALTSDGFLRATIDTLQLPDGPHTLLATAQDIPGNAAAVPVGMLVDNHAPALSVTAPRRVVLGLPLRVQVTASDPVSGLSGAPALTFGDGKSAVGARAVHVYRKSGPYVVRVRQRDRAATRASPRGACRSSRCCSTPPADAARRHGSGSAALRRSRSWPHTAASAYVSCAACARVCAACRSTSAQAAGASSRAPPTALPHACLSCAASSMVDCARLVRRWRASGDTRPASRRRSRRAKPAFAGAVAPARRGVLPMLQPQHGLRRRATPGRA